MKRNPAILKTATLMTVALALASARAPAGAQTGGEGCVPSKDVLLCPAESTTRVASGALPDTVAISVESPATLGQTRIELPAASESINLGLQPPASGFGDAWGLEVRDADARSVARLEVANQAGATVITTTAEVSSWRFEASYQGQLVAEQVLAAAVLQGVGPIFDEVSVRQDGTVTYRWTEAGFQLADGSWVDTIDLTGSGAFGALLTGDLTTSHEPISLEDWLIKNRSVIACSPVDWVEQLGSSFADGARDVAAYDFGSIARGEAYITGTFSGTASDLADFGFEPPHNLPGYSSRAGTGDMFLAKVNDCGHWSWVRTGGSDQGDDVGHAVAVDSQRNVVVVGNMSGPSVTIDPSPGLPLVSRTGFGDPTLFAAKYDPQGDLIWFRTYGAGTAVDVDTNSDNDVFMTVTKPNSMAGSVLQLSAATGLPVQSGAINSSALGVEITGVVVGNSDRLCVVGNFTDTLTVNGSSVSAAGTYQSAFLAFYDANLTLDQLHAISTDSGDVTANAVTMAWHDGGGGGPLPSPPSWDCLVAGDFQGSLMLDYLPLSTSYPGDTDAFVARYDYHDTANVPQGVVQIGGFGAQHAEDLGVADHGHGPLWVTGSFEIEAQSWTSENAFGFWSSPLTTFGGRDGFLLKFNDFGWLQWATQFGGLGDDDGMGVAVLPKSKQIYAAGAFDDKADFLWPSRSVHVDSLGRGRQGFVGGVVKH
ncbi:MAG: hypothetical protein AAF560_11010 [Acidobacteriota bacterium]